MKRFIIVAAALLLTATVRAQSEPVADTLSSAPATADAAAGAHTPTGAAFDNRALWEAGNTAYINGDYGLAAEVYSSILERGVFSSKLYYNLGNALFKEGRLGEAILNYRRALRLAPGNEDIRYNLSVAENRTKDKIESLPEFFLTSWIEALRHLLGGTTWTLLSLVFLTVMLATALCYLLAQRLAVRKAGFYLTLVFALFFVASTSFAAKTRREAIDHDRAVVMSSSVPVKSSPDKASTDLFVLHEGTSVRITGRLGDWVEVVIADGKKGWLEGRRIEII